MLIRATCAMVCFVVSIAGIATAGSSVPCDTGHQADLDRAFHERLSGDYNGAIAISQATLQQSPDNPRAQYTLGLALLDKASHENQMSSALNSQALALLSQVANTVEKDASTTSPATIACLKSDKVFSIMNTLGYLYKDTDPKKSEWYLDKSLALDKRGLLESKTRGRTYENLGDLYVQIGDFSTASTFYGNAKAAGNKNPDIDKRLSAIHLVISAQQVKKSPASTPNGGKH